MKHARRPTVRVAAVVAVAALAAAVDVAAVVVAVDAPAVVVAAAAVGAASSYLACKLIGSREPCDLKDHAGACLTGLAPAFLFGRVVQKTHHSRLLGRQKLGPDRSPGDLEVVIGSYKHDVLTAGQRSGEGIGIGDLELLFEPGGFFSMRRSHAYNFQGKTGQAVQNGLGFLETVRPCQNVCDFSQFIAESSNSVLPILALLSKSSIRPAPASSSRKRSRLLASSTYLIGLACVPVRGCDPAIFPFRNSRAGYE